MEQFVAHLRRAGQLLSSSKAHCWRRGVGHEDCVARDKELTSGRLHVADDTLLLCQRHFSERATFDPKGHNSWANCSATAH